MKELLMIFCILSFASTSAFADFNFCNGTLNKELSMRIAQYDQDKDLEKIELFITPDRTGFHLRINDNSGKELNEGRCFLQMDKKRISRFNNFNNTWMYTSDSCNKVSDYISLHINERKVGQLSYSLTNSGYRNYVFDLKCN